MLGKLGAGGMGAVYRARQVSLGRMVALKVLPAQFMEDAESVARFQREARVAASLNHGNLVKVYAAGEAEGSHYIAMELIEGEDLGGRLKREGRLAAPEALRICVEVARGLEHGWQRAQLVHRDIKPGNIFLAAGGVVKVGDLGLAKLLDSQSTGLTQSGTMMGTPHYMSPEQGRGERAMDFRADIYSLGCTLYQMLSGETPYGGREAVTLIHQHIHAPLPAIMKVWPACPIPLARLVAKMLKKSRHERHASYEELIAQMAQIRAQLDLVGVEPAAEAPAARDAVGTAGPGGVGTPRRGVLGEAAAPEEGRRGAPSLPPPAKPQALLSGGIVAGVVVLGVIAILVWPREEKLTKAQLYAKQRETEPPAAAPGERRFVAAPTAAGAGGGKVGGDEAPPSSGALAGATQEAPFVNTLGMKFVPVPIAGGPSAGQRVLFGVWAVRVADYAAYAEANPKANGEWKTQHKDGVPAGRELDHPVVGVNWEDAQAFCRWLTEKEIAEGKLPKGMKYRLPSDEEWSWAVGLPPEVGATPEEKHGKNDVDFPWGKEWPPVQKVGNYADATWHAKFPPKKNEKDNRMENDRWMEGYTDGYATTSPVGSFPANGYGLYDMGGNVWQWCEDWWNKDQKGRFLRGASWNHVDRGDLRSSHRARNAPTSRVYYCGFRCVVGASAP